MNTPSPKALLAMVAVACAAWTHTALAQQAGPAATAPKNMKLFLLIGQSNMAGRGKVEPQDQETNPRIFMLDAGNAWVPAKDPVHFDKPGMAGVGLCSEFARVLVRKDPKIVVGLIPCAFGGTPLAKWMPGDDPKSLYNNAVARAKVAMASGTLAGILWHQGESDAGAPQGYEERFASMVTQLRKDLNAEKAPVIVGELCNKSPFNKVIQALPAKVPHCAWASSAGCTNDGLHFNRQGCILLGQRYAEKYFELTTPGHATGRSAHAPSTPGTHIATSFRRAEDAGGVEIVRGEF